MNLGSIDLYGRSDVLQFLFGYFTTCKTHLVCLLLSLFPVHEVLQIELLGSWNGIACIICDKPVPHQVHPWIPLVLLDQSEVFDLQIDLSNVLHDGSYELLLTLGLRFGFLRDVLQSATIPSTI
jgi:hypothetical protein